MAKHISEERITQKLSKTAEKKSKKGILAIVIITVVAIILIISLVLLFAKPKTNRKNVVVTPDNVDEVLSDMQDQKTSSGTYEVTMNTTWHFKNGTSASSDAYVENSTSNTNDVFFDVVLPETKETIFTSPTIPVGSHLENITLDKELESGTYNCVLTYHLLDDNGDTKSTLRINVNINVEN